jgi:putative ABC transport system ATP-binding protein
VLAVLRRSNQELKQTVMMITHNPEAAAVGDRILHMRDGELLDAAEHAAAEATSANTV